MFRRCIEIGALIVAYLKIIFTFDLAFAIDAKDSFVAGMAAVPAVLGVAHDVDAGTPA